ncbi:MAG: hypothetical protein ACLR7L_03060 [Enterocloster sp.]|uniref:hypothetical protein n=1 Tax=Enterocloster bolteae TaxID=208479 RepID=UPI0005717609|nr:hypothetical protein [Enterocloster bolteae]MCG4901451.1 hypothetical protein [Enterocloster bolteae]RGB96608.1 hypothetical protein DWZ21_17450 [Hungatella hathewayi]UOX71675.1 hypothetical protein K4205_08450 [Enterocloster bolteae]
MGDNYFMGVENGVEWNGVGCLAGGQGRLGAVLGMGGSGSAGRQPWKRLGVPRAVGRSPHKKPDKKPGGKR